MTPAEIADTAKSRAVVGLCPITEANLVHVLRPEIEKALAAKP